MNVNGAIYIKTFFLSLTLLYVVVSTADYKSFDVGDEKKASNLNGRFGK